MPMTCISHLYEFINSYLLYSFNPTFRYFCPSGKFYEGGYKNDNRHGYGEFLFSNGDKYIGHFECDNRHGKGEYKWKDGRREIGQWVNDKRHGSAEYYDRDGKKYEHLYKNGKIIED